MFKKVEKWMVRRFCLKGFELFFVFDFRLFFYGFFVEENKVYSFEMDEVLGGYVVVLGRFLWILMVYFKRYFL